MNLMLCLCLTLLWSTGQNKLCKKTKWNPFRRKHIAALILARGGSKGIPLKNIAKVNGKSLLSRSLSVVNEVKEFDAVWVSTDQKLIAEEAEKYDAQVHWRDANTAEDDTPSIFAVQEFANKHKEVDIIALIQCTSPFLNAQYLIEALDYISRVPCVFSATRSYKLRWRKLQDEIVPINFRIDARPRRQDWAGEFIENGMFYLASRDMINNGLFQSTQCGIIEIADRFSAEIDTPWDLYVANKLADILDHEWATI